MDNSQDQTTNPQTTEEIEETLEHQENDDIHTNEIQTEGNGESEALGRLELEGLIQRHMDDVEELKSKLKEQREMLNSTVENDATYSEKEEQAKELKKEVTEIKKKLTEQPAVAEIKERMQDIKSEIKEGEEAISAFAEKYKDVAGTNQIMKDDGEVLEIVSTYKIRKKKT